MRFLLSILLLTTLVFSMSLKQSDNSQLLLHVKNYVLKNYSIKNPEKKFNMDIMSSKLDGNYMLIETVPAYENGLYVETEYIEDISFVFCLEKKDAKWEIIYDLSRNDVPSTQELQYIKREFPSNFPKKLLPKFWQKKLNL